MRKRERERERKRENERERERTRGVRKREKAAWGEFEGVDEESRRPTRSLKKLSKFLSALRRAPIFENSKFF